MSQQKRRVEVVPYDPNWPRLFEQEVALLTPIFESSYGVSTGNSESLAKRVACHHIGSTSVSALAAKPIIDILLEVPDIEQLGPKKRIEPGVFEENSESLAKQVNENSESLAKQVNEDSIAFALHKHAYEHMGEYGLPGRRYFRKLDGVRHLVHIHSYQIGNPEIIRHLAFRDYLRAHPDVANQYASVKLALATKFPDSPANYQTGKDTYVEEVERIALEWHNSQVSGST
jgi:GrpB-like predicted nucleotidyltransferase (UPF0157 family)